MPSRLRPAELGALAVALAVFAFGAWDQALWEPRLQLVLHLLGAGAVATLAVLGRRGLPLPRTRLDLPVLLMLLAYGVASLSALNPGLSLRALASAIGFAAMLWVGLVALRHRPAGTAQVVALPVLAISAISLASMLPRRVEWYLAGGPGLVPPARLGGDGSLFGGVAVAPFVIGATLPLTLLLPRGRARLGLQIALLAVGIPLTVFSGSRSALLAIGVAGLVLVAPMLRHLRPLLRVTRRTLAAGAVAAAVALPLLLTLAPRLTAFTSVVYRGFLWRDTLAAASADPLLGLGPGAMPFARQAAAPPYSFPVHQPHSHNLALGVFGDAGVAGIVAGIALLAVFLRVAGPWRQRSPAGRAAAAALVGLAVAGLFEDLTFLPGFNLLVILLAGLALLDAGAVTWQRWRPPRSLAVAGVVGGIALGAGILLGDAAAIEYAYGVEQGIEGRWDLARGAFEEAERLDPWHPLHPKALAIAAAVAGDLAASRAAASRAVALNPGDADSWTNLALVCRDAGDPECAAHAAGQAARTAGSSGREVLNAALVLNSLGLTAAADDAYLRAILANRNVGFVVVWPRRVDLDALVLPELGLHDRELNLLVARLTAGEPLLSDGYASRPVQALALALDGRTADAQSALETAISQETELELTWEVAVLLHRHWGEETDRVERLAALVRGGPLPTSTPRLPGAVFDIAAFRRVPLDGLIPAAEHLLPEVRWPWILEPYLPDR